VVPDTSAVTWNWNFGNGQSSTLMNPSPVQYQNAGNYPVSLVVTNSSGCRDSVSTNIDAYPIPVVSAGPDTLICQGTGRMLNATGADTYQWSPATGLSCTNCQNPIATPAVETQYIVTGTTIHGCSSIDSVTVSVVLPFQMTTYGGDTLCVGKSTRMAASGAHHYQWSPAAGLDDPTAATPIASPQSTTNYMVVGFDDKQCFTDTSYIRVVVYPIPTVDAGPDKTINVGQTIDLVPTISPDVTAVTWTPTGSIFRNDFPAISVKPRETTTYQIIAKNPGKCTAVDQVTVHVICNGANVFIPNTFSPNGDGSNDIFYPRGTGLFNIKTMRIFNRWGEMVFEKSNFNANDMMSGWDGTYKGQKLNPDVFVYIIDVRCDNDNTLNYKGNVTLIR
jgi:gliding motility-associated-like protein